jgi:predicted MPP superfamily phosphohydrolase
MRKHQMLIFFLTVFAIYFCVNGYVFFRGWQMLPAASTLRVWYAVLFVVVALSFIIGRVLENYWLSPVSDLFVWVGSFWLAALLYFVLACLVVDLGRLLLLVMPVSLPEFGDPVRVRQHVMFGIVAVVALIVAGGFWNARSPQVRRVTVHINKPTDGIHSLRIVMASDIHLGTIIGRSRLASLVERINEIRPDLVLFAGDVVDEDLAPVIRQNLGETLLAIRSRMGIYGITGNHEYIGGAEKACAYLEAHGIRMLRDTCVELDGGILLAGREDRSSRQFGGRQRKSLDALLSGVDRRKPLILMDHQPFHLEEASSHAVDLQLSGHTHHGQLWPFNFITSAVYELSWGYLLKDSTHFYVSSGFGTWGPPVRTGNRPEIVELTVTFGAAP